MNIGWEEIKLGLIKEREIWLLRLEVGGQSIVGHEQGGTRPCLIIKSLPNLELATIIPMTSNKHAINYPSTYEVHSSLENGLKSVSIAMIFHIRSVSFDRFIQKWGIIDDSMYTDILNLISDYFSN